MKITNLRCCLLTNPLGIDRAQPELSWEFTEPTEGSSRQVAYRVTVATTPDRLDTPDLWDSGRVEDARSFFITYAGQPLESRVECHWRVEAWDESGQHLLSTAAYWSMGLLSPGDWSALWIGSGGSSFGPDGDACYPESWFGSAQWIWAADSTPGTWTFSHEFDLEEGTALSDAFLEVLADDEAEVFLNDQPVCRSLRARAHMNLSPGPVPVWMSADRFQTGRNCLQIVACKRPGVDQFTKLDAAGVIARLRLNFANGQPPREIVTNRNWNCEGQNNRQAIVELGAFGQAPWHRISTREYPNLNARYLRTEIDLPSAPRRATLYFSGLGLSEAFINGRKVGNEVLSPNPTDYDRRVFYRTYDVTNFLQPGRNALGALLGNGRYFAPRANVPFPMAHYGSPKMLWQLEVTFEDGTTRRVTSAPEWKVSTEGPLGWNNEFDGEHYDARKKFNGWNKAVFDETGWTDAVCVARPCGSLQAQLAEPLRVIRRIKPLSQWTTKYGTTIYDFGENVAGWTHIHAEGETNTRLRLFHAETLDGEHGLFMDNLRSAHCCDVVVLDSKPLDYEPRFTIHGFRYVELREEVGTCRSFEIEACVVHDDVKVSGHFSCSDPTINSIVSAARRGILGNYRGMPTDCPQRDERMGWLGDRAVGAAGEMILFDVAAFYRKWLQDIRDAQMPNGCVPDVAPPYWKMYTDNVTWPACMTFIPHWLHRHYGDSPEAVRHFPAAQLWIEHLLALRHDGLIERDVYGDWCVPPESPDLIHSESPDRKTPGPLVSSCYMVRILEQGAQFAEMAGHTDVSERWLTEADAMRAAINRRYFNSELANYANGSQTASLLPLAFDIVSKDNRDRVFERFVASVLETGEPIIGTGLIGTGWLLRTLTAFGRADLACAIASRTKYPSWGYMMEQGATTLWELWNGNTADPAMNSGNHVMLLGDLLPWLFEDLAGIQPAEPGFRHITLRPAFPEALQQVTASCQAMPGLISSNWHRKENEEIEWSFTIPANVTATAFLPPQAQIPNASDAQKVVTSTEGWQAGFGPGTHTIRFQLPCTRFASPQTKENRAQLISSQSCEVSVSPRK